MLRALKKGHEPEINILNNVAVQAIVVCLISMSVALICPFAEAEETDSLNAVHDFVSGSITLSDIFSSKFGQLILLGLPLMFFQRNFPSLPIIDYLLISIIIIPVTVSLIVFSSFDKMSHV